MLTNLRDDVKLGLRALRHDRGFALAAVLSIGLGVGANSALFSLVDQALLRMLPVREPGRLVLLDWKGTFIGKGWGTSNLMSYPFYRDLHDETQVFDGVFARFPTGVDLMIDGTPEQANAEIVTGSYFPVLGVRPAMGLAAAAMLGVMSLGIVIQVVGVRARTTDQGPPTCETRVA